MGVRRPWGRGTGGSTAARWPWRPVGERGREPGRAEPCGCGECRRGAAGVRTPGTGTGAAPAEPPSLPRDFRGLQLCPSRGGGVSRPPAAPSEPALLPEVPTRRRRRGAPGRGPSPRPSRGPRPPASRPRAGTRPTRPASLPWRVGAPARSAPGNPPGPRICGQRAGPGAGQDEGRARGAVTGSGVPRGRGWAGHLHRSDAGEGAPCRPPV